MSNKEKIYKPTVKLHQFEYQLTDETNQTIITFPIPPGTTKEAIQVDQGENHLSVGLKGSEPIVCGILFGPIDVKKSRTIFDTNGIFMIMLIKKNPIKWPLLIFSKYKGHIDPHSLVLKAAFYEHNNEYSVSLDLLKMAADKKHFTAIFKLAAIYTEYSKFKIKLDFPLALKYWKMGSDLGHSDSSLM
ncbi:chronic myelogenous leukemia tumor antigen 66 [Anaeramoeba flamelloides]|uniref:Chronic myelogenous leukemia tumor antigen n=1 Tax=Anaeramoeba flamelloides TaxID=1746091 RepID=A0AAV8AB05_9EUKA|nr:chronic myelogenous leukemia tumor antigen [Anaeramoeba flamelloides]KAJ6250971.1 chronic myelogenous leukemia tumor antigen 66 [Anaeramoeba flamelloides]